MTRSSAFSARRIFIALAVVLSLALIALVGYLIWNATAPRFVTSEPKAGLVADLVIDTTGRSVRPTFDRPLGAAFGKNGEIVVADSGNNRIVVFDASGNFVREFGGLGVAKPGPGAKATWKPGLLNYPVAVDVDDKGDLYVADFYNDSISVFSPDGTFLRRFPDPSKPVGKGSSGQNGGGIAVTDVRVVGDRVYATDAYQVFVFSRDGKLLGQFGKPGTGPRDLDHPNGVVADESGIVYVADSNNNRVSAFDASGTPLWQLGKPVTDLTKDVGNPFNVPRGLAVLENGDILVVDALAQRLVRVSPDGKVVATYGSRGVAPSELNFPNSIDVRGNSLLIADKENNRVQVLRIVGQ